MTSKNLFQQPGSWFKGALHAHTTRSDGKLTPAESVAAHRQAGYHFLAVTDHDVITDLTAYNDDQFLTIPGVEVAHGHNALGQSFHVVLVGIRKLNYPRYAMSIQEAIDTWGEQAQLMFLAHPYWSGMALEEMRPLERLAGLEIWNTSAQTDLGKGLATSLWDELLGRGKAWAGFAVDDTHGINDDFAGGWVWAKSAQLDETSILHALNQGDFYTSTGPVIEDFQVANNQVYVRCSPVTVINVIGLTEWGGQRRAAPGTTITEYEYKLKGKERYVRAECRDAFGHTAWTNPIFLDQ